MLLFFYTFTQMKIEIYTDGACSGNPGKGGYGIVMRIPENNYEKRFMDGYRLTTNNRMELMAVIVAFQKLKNHENELFIYSDSKYVTNALNENWLEKWQERKFKNVKNVDLWKAFLTASKGHEFHMIWVKGHDGNTFNEIADQLAVKASKEKNLKIDKGFEESQKIIS